MLVIGLGLLAAFGFCFYAGWFYADMHPIIPFLLLGIGVDDMFVIVKVCRYFKQVVVQSNIYIKVTVVRIRKTNS